MGIRLCSLQPPRTDVPLGDAPPPFFPIFSDGQFAIYIFFVLSGYVLSIGYFEHGSRKIVASLALRRYPRLTIPILASSTLACLFMTVGFFHSHEAGHLLQNAWLSSFYTFQPSLRSLLSFGLWDVYARYALVGSYNAVLWTMAYEMLGSIMVFALLLIFGKGKFAASATAIVGTLLWHSNHPLFAFLLGMIIAWGATLEFVNKALNSRTLYGPAWILLCASLLGAMFRQDIGAQPRMLSLMAAAVLLSLIALPPLQRFFSNGLSQVPGWLSFPLYLTHLLVICSWSSWLFIRAKELGFSDAATTALVGLSTLIIAFLAAACFAPIERFSVNFSQQVSKWVLAPFVPHAKVKGAQAQLAIPRQD